MRRRTTLFAAPEWRPAGPSAPVPGVGRCATWLASLLLRFVGRVPDRASSVLSEEQHAAWLTSPRRRHVGWMPLRASPVPAHGVALVTRVSLSSTCAGARLAPPDVGWRVASLVAPEQCPRAGCRSASPDVRRRAEARVTIPAYRRPGAGVRLARPRLAMVGGMAWRQTGGGTRTECCCAPRPSRCGTARGAARATYAARLVPDSASPVPGVGERAAWIDLLRRRSVGRLPLRALSVPGSRHPSGATRTRSRNVPRKVP